MPRNGRTSMKLIPAVILIAILASLGSALVFLIRDGSKTRRTLQALTVRIALSVALFLFLMFGYWMGWFVPNQRPY
jgi:Protein of unknown function (DUF2909)